MEVMSAPAALAILGDGLNRESVGALAERPMLAIRVDDSPAMAAVTRAARDLPCVVVGVSDSPVDELPAPPLDVLLAGVATPPAPWVGCPDGTAAAIDDIAETASLSPSASIALVQVLRAGGGLTFHDALLTESLAYGLLQSGSEYRAWLARREERTPRLADEPVLVAREGDAVTITLNRPDVHNAFDRSMRDALVAAFQLVAADTSVTEVHLRGAGPSFCSGGDLAEFGTVPDPVIGHLVRSTRSAASWLAGISDRVTAHLHGSCIGAGLELAALAARVIATDDTLLMLPEVRMGLVPGAGGTATLPRRIGRQRTAYLALSGRTVDATTAHSWGLVDVISHG